MNYAVIKPTDVANGPGVRVSLFVSGCRHHCKGCFNQEAWDFNYGTPYTQETEDQIISALSQSYITGLTLLGGEPFEPENQPVLLSLLRRIRRELPEKTIWAFSGFTLEADLLTDRLGCPDVTGEILSYLEVLVDGKFILDQKDIRLRFRGSSNQRLLNMPETLRQGRPVLWDA